MWSIVHFTKDNSVETVPSKWFRRNKCAWPNNNSTHNIETQADPNTNDFKWYTARVLLSNIESFSEANRKCQTALITSDLSSAEVEEGVQNTKIKKLKEIKQHTSMKLNEPKIIKNTGYDVDNSDIDTDDANEDKTLQIPIYESDDDNINIAKITTKASYNANKQSCSLPYKFAKTGSKIKSPSRKTDLKSPAKKSFYLSKTQSSKTESPRKITDTKSPVKKSFHLSTSQNSRTESPKKKTDSKSPVKKSFYLSPIGRSKIESPNKKKKFKSPIKMSSQLFLNQCVFEESEHNNLQSLFHDSCMSPELFSKSPSSVSPSNADNRSPLKSPIEKNVSVKKRLFVNSAQKSPKKNVLHSIMSSGSSQGFKSGSRVKHFSGTKSNKCLSDEQFKEFMQHNMIILKHNMRNIDEKLTSLIEKTDNKLNFNDHNVDKDVIDYSYLDCLFPINEENVLNDIEEQLSADKKYKSALLNKLVGLGGKSIKIFVRRIMQFLFTNEILKLFSFRGRANKKKCFANLMLSQVIFNAVKSLKKFQSETVNEDTEKYIKNALIQAPFIIKNNKNNIVSSNTI